MAAYLSGNDNNKLAYACQLNSFTHLRALFGTPCPRHFGPSQQAASPMGGSVEDDLRGPIDRSQRSMVLGPSGSTSTLKVEPVVLIRMWRTRRIHVKRWQGGRRGSWARSSRTCRCRSWRCASRQAGGIRWCLRRRYAMRCTCTGSRDGGSIPK
jgi:hypothetical protein